MHIHIALWMSSHLGFDETRVFFGGISLLDGSLIEDIKKIGFVTHDSLAVSSGALLAET